ncbi:hypothetical protein ElyMa_005204000 [Elysia marginata]|uniref:Annexin n=1 Tax=Elysia marginata TaxID=1093978 RepID=A0AAV4JX86_9GAST|nr:hypothetical protein ElyMa_005204000 [Elysia marginata]
MKSVHKKTLGNPLVAGATASKIASKIPKSVWIVGGVAVVGFVLWQLHQANKFFGGAMEKIGLKDDENDQKVKNFSSSTDYLKAFQPAYHRNSGSSLKIATDQEIQTKAELIHDAFGFLNDDEEKIIGVFNSFSSKVDISRLTDFYFKKYEKDLYATLKGGLDSEEMAEIIDIVKRKP